MAAPSRRYRLRSGANIDGATHQQQIQNAIAQGQEDATNETSTLDETDTLVETDTISETDTLVDTDTISEIDTLVDVDTLSEADTLGETNTLDETVTQAESDILNISYNPNEPNIFKKWTVWWLCIVLGPLLPLTMLVSVMPLILFWARLMILGPRQMLLNDMSRHHPLPVVGSENFSPVPSHTFGQQY